MQNHMDKNMNDDTDQEEQRANFVIKNLTNNSNNNNCAHKPPLIQIVTEKESSLEITDVDNDLPPSISINRTACNAPNNSDNLTLMDQMIQEAKKAREEKVKSTQRKQVSNGKSFGDGIKKGFLQKNVTKAAIKERLTTSKSVTKSTKDNNNNIVYELDSEGNMLESTASAKEEPITVRSTSQTQQSRISKDVQNTIETQFAALMEQQQQWTTPELLQEISNNPRISAGMSNPSYMLAFKEFQENPKSAMLKYRSNKDIQSFLSEFCSILGHHFTKLGEEQKQKQQQQHGPLVEAALQRLKEKERSLIQEVTEQEVKDQKETDKILSNPELTQLLLDPEMQLIIQECTSFHNGNKFMYYMKHPDYAPKLRKLIEAGLLKVESDM